jgi:hypothetical protein
MFDEYDGFLLFPALKYFPIFYVLLNITYILLLLPHNDLDCTFTLLIVLDAKYLGCLITSDLRWTNHINRICGNANKTPSGIGTHFNKTARGMELPTGARGMKLPTF